MSNSEMPDPPPTPPVTDFRASTVAAPQENTLALISFIAAIVVLPLIPVAGIGFAGPIVAIIAGHMGLARARTLPPAQSRRWMAITGLILGYLYLAVFLAVGGLFLVLSLIGPTSNPIR